MTDAQHDLDRCVAMCLVALASACDLLPERPGHHQSVEASVETADAGGPGGSDADSSAGDGPGEACMHSSSESCDSVDNDCNGWIDDGIPSQPCDAGAGACGVGVSVCINGTTECLAQQGPQPELCNGQDDNCDGLVDDGFDVGTPCTVGLGACTKTGRIVCSTDQGSSECDAVGAPPAPDLCNQIDDDCDGIVDGTRADDGIVNFACAPGVPDAGGSPCTAAAEECDGRDNDCNGLVDDGLTREPCVAGQGECASGATACVNGSIVCIAGRQPAQERCDGRDNNCDGLVDDSFLVGATCTRGIGACRRGGTVRCRIDQRAGECDVVAGDPTPEVCNGLDDDCDGFVDGALRDGGITSVCPPDTTTPPSGAPPGCTPVPERCDGTDNDCDGTIDDETASASCVAGLGECAAGTTACVDGNTVCLPQRSPAPERCDGLDNNCDGTVDDRFHIGQRCSVGFGECGRSGTMVCTPDEANGECNVVEGQPAPERCNDMDDDCDGLVDYSLRDGRITSACVCSSLALRVQSAAADPGEVTAAQSTCEVAGDEVRMRYQLTSCTGSFPWAQCILRSASLNRFDPDHLAPAQRPSILEVRFCTSTTVHGALNLYYGNYPGRKRLRLLTEQQGREGLPAGCYTRFFAPSDAECPSFPDPIDPRDAAATLNAACRTGCSAGRWSDRDTACSFDYDNVPLYLTSEFCIPGQADGSVLVTGVQLKLHSPTCACRSEADCRDLSKPNCDSSARLPDAACSASTPRCAGLCVAP